MQRITMACVMFTLLLATHAEAQNMPAEVQTRTTSSGKTVLTDANGMTLYAYDPDAPDKSNCNGACARIWPPLAAPESAAPMGAWTIVTRQDGSKQWAYLGRPLYSYVNDHRPGETSGDGIGGVWHIATPAGAQQPASTAYAPAAQAYGAEAAPGAQPSYPGIPPSKEHLEIPAGPYKLRVYGTVLMNIQGSDRPSFGQDVVLWALPGSGTFTYPDGTVGSITNQHDLLFTMRQSILGFTVNPATWSTDGWNASALAEMDFFGPRPVDTSEPLDRVLDQPRLRMAYLQLQHKGVKIIAGQDEMILAPLDPISLSHVAAPLGATAGDLWGWFPQIRLELNHTIGDTGVLFQLGVLDPIFGDPRLESPPAASTSFDISSSGLGARSTQPFYQSRLAVSPKLMGRTATIGISGHFGQEKVGVNNILQSWAGAFDLDIPFSSHLILRGEGFAGSNLIPFQGGIDQGAAVLAVSPTASIIQPIFSAGGWAEITILPGNSDKDAFYFGAGTDNPKKSDLLPGTSRTRNSLLWASYFHKFTDSVTAALEWSYWDFQTTSFVGNIPGPRGVAGRSNVVNLALTYQF